MTFRSDPKEFTCFDDNPENNGWGYNARKWDLDEDEELEDEGELEIVTDDE